MHFEGGSVTTEEHCRMTLQFLVLRDYAMFYFECRTRGYARRSAFRCYRLSSSAFFIPHTCAIICLHRMEFHTAAAKIYTFTRSDTFLDYSSARKHSTGSFRRCSRSCHRNMVKRGSKEKRLAATVGRCYLQRLEKLLSMHALSCHFHVWRMLCEETSKLLQRKLNVVSYRMAMSIAFQRRARYYYALWRDLCFVRLRRIPPPPGLTLPEAFWQ